MGLPVRVQVKARVQVRYKCKVWGVVMVRGGVRVNVRAKVRVGSSDGYSHTS